ncbi:MAG: zinc metallopeptidase [Deinococcus sp.]|nr:zinc metallopeptidase [Deinococcus sp.]
MLFFDPLYLVLMMPAILLALWAQVRVSAAFSQYQRMASRSGLSGAEVARHLLTARGLSDVQVERAQGFLTDHYDPRTKTLRLSQATYDSRSVAALGVAAHETGHALQHADGYAPLQFRSAIVPVISLGSRLLPWLIIIGIFGGLLQQPGPFAYVFIAILFGIAGFSLVTLPVEFNASHRALALLSSSGVLARDELDGASKVLNAAALTYVAAAVGALLQLLYWLVRLGLLGGRRRD